MIELELNDVVHYKYNGSRERSNFIVTAGSMHQMNKDVQHPLSLKNEGRPIVISHVVRDGITVYKGMAYDETLFE